MTNWKKDILSCLNEIKGSGSFASSRSAPFVFPGLEVESVGELSYPINELQAKALINTAHKAPFGKGSSTIVDDKVRSAWEIDAAILKFNGDKWVKFLHKALSAIKPDLGIEEDEITAHLYKMLIYEKGDFFLPHKDSEKEKGMFGTLVIGLPSRHSGGDLLVRFDGKEKVIKFDDCCDDGVMPYAAFYADCDHEIRPLTSGYRVVLVYNLIQLKVGKQIHLEPLEKHVTKLANLLKADANHTDMVPRIILLGHQYTPENFSTEGLKLDDRTRAEALLRAARQAGYYAKMCLVTSYKAGTPAYDGYGYEDGSDEDTVIEDVYDESLYIEHWLNEGVPPLRNITFEENDLLASFHLDDDEPIVKESTGYMGNYGPDIMHWYHYGAVILWSAKTHEKLLPEQTTANKLEWIAYYNKNRDWLSKSEITWCETILSGPLDEERYYESADYNIIVDWLLGENDVSCFHKIGNRLLKEYFLKIDASHWAKLTHSYPTKYLEAIFTEVSQQGNPQVIEHLLAILHTLDTQPDCRSLVGLILKALPGYFAEHKKNVPPVTAKSLRDILSLESTFPQNKAWVDTMTAILVTHTQRSYINAVLAGEIIAMNKRTKLAYQLLLVCRDDLQNRVSDKPQPPGDWSRPVPRTKRYFEQWKLLAGFMQSPVEQVFDYRKNQQEREWLEDAIRNVETDLTIETIRKGSPHTLRITKTQAAYKRQLKEWNEDASLLKKVKEKLETFSR
ncbi:2OG-Fe(II) oxygenase [Reichenbachiella sp. MALMAid0571]|uniref:2OG-Fe(II) oxygenase n=1 Tax=Reichenbachiella sp. MALMAid0571 TaxID=3143939 RepID=UPI0032DE449A